MEMASQFWLAAGDAEVRRGEPEDRLTQRALITTRGVSEGQRWQPGIQSKVSQHALRASGVCHPAFEIFSTRATFTRDAIPR